MQSSHNGSTSASACMRLAAGIGKAEELLTAARQAPAAPSPDPTVVAPSTGPAVNHVVSGSDVRYNFCSIWFWFQSDVWPQYSTAHNACMRPQKENFMEQPFGELMPGVGLSFDLSCCTA